MMQRPLPASTTGWVEQLQCSLAERDTGLLDALALVSRGQGAGAEPRAAANGAAAGTSPPPPAAAPTLLACPLFSGGRLCGPGALVGSTERRRCLHLSLLRGSARGDGGVAAAQPLQLGAVARAAGSAAPLLRCRRSGRLGRHAAVPGQAATLQRPALGRRCLPPDAHLHVVWRHRQRHGERLSEAGINGPPARPPTCPRAPASTTLCAQALARPLRLAWHLPAQLLTMAFIYSHNGAICGTAALSHPSAQRATAATYAALSALPTTLGAPLLRQHGPEGRCRAVLALAELLLGLLAPTILLAASEVALFERYARRCAKRQQQQQQAARQLGAVAGSSSAAAQQAVPLSTPQPGRLASLLYRFLGACLRLALGEPADVAAAALTATLLLAATWRGILALTPDC